MEYHPNHVILHVGTNEASTRKTAEDIAKNIISVCNGLKNNDNEITVSGLIYRKNVHENVKIDEINDNLQILCHERNHLLSIIATYHPDFYVIGFI